MRSSEETLSDVSPTSTRSGRDGWWRHAAVYQVYVRSFSDGNGDGLGDLPGIRARLGHLAELGVDAVWLTPFYPSPMVDGGYDVADFRDVAQEFGDLGDFDALLAETHRLGLRLIIDIVPNHTSHAHPWFVEALRAGPGSRARERYIFRPGRGSHGELPPNNWESVFGGRAWSRVHEPDGTPGEWYLHLFAPEQPDLNWHDAEVRAEFADVLRFWLDRGVDGIRIDVAHGLFKAEGLPDTGRGRAGMLDTATQPYWDQEPVHEVYREWRRILDSYPGERIAVAEAWLPSLERTVRYLRPDELHQAFNFDFLTADFDAEAFRAVITETMEAFRGLDSPPAWVLSNHDVARHASRYGGGERGRARARAASLVMLALPGSAYLYQGEELGLEDVDDLPEAALQDPTWERSGRTVRGRDGCRVPIPWEGEEPPFGFGAAPSWLPAPEHWAGATVAAQRHDPASTLRLYRAALGLRREFRGAHSLSWRESPAGVLAFTVDTGLSCIAHMGSEPVRIEVPGELLLASQEVVVADGTAVLPPDSASWWRE